MKKIILIVISAALLFANSAEDTTAPTKTEAPKEVSKAEIHVPIEVKTLKRETALEAKLAKREAQRAETTKAREERLKKLDTDLATKAELRSTIVY